jgi:hypothetical protein
MLPDFAYGFRARWESPTGSHWFARMGRETRWKKPTELKSLVLVVRETRWKKPTGLPFNPLGKLTGTVGGLQRHPLVRTVDGDDWVFLFLN